MLKEFGHWNPIIIFYGSNIYNESSSDLDICFVFSKEIPAEVKQQIIERTKDFQKERMLCLDEEIPFENKLIYSFCEIEDIYVHSPFREGDRYKLDTIVKSEEFLSSKLMKQRLFINILTTDHRVINDKNKYISSLELRAWNEILLMLKNVFGTDLSNLEQVLDHLYVNPSTFMGGEMHLGYKLGNPKKRKYLRRRVKHAIKLFSDKLTK